MFIFKWLQRHPTGIRFDLAISTPPIQFRYKEKVIAAYASMILQFGGGVILPLFNIRFFVWVFVICSSCPLDFIFPL